MVRRVRGDIRRARSEETTQRVRETQAHQLDHLIDLPLSQKCRWRPENGVTAESDVRDSNPRLTAYCLLILQKASVSEVAEAEADVS